MNNKNYKLPTVAWLKVTGFMHGWIEHELGGGARIGEQRVVCLHHLQEARQIMRMETCVDTGGNKAVGNAMSATRRNCIVLGLEMGPEEVERMYGMTAEQLGSFLPVECSEKCLTADGVLRKWTGDVCFGREQANALQRLLRAAFWEAVGEFNAEYARRMEGKKYPSIEMVEAFCRETGTSEVHAEAIKREWDRRVARGDNKR